MKLAVGVADATETKVDEGDPDLLSLMLQADQKEQTSKDLPPPLGMATAETPVLADEVSRPFPKTVDMGCKDEEVSDLLTLMLSYEPGQTLAIATATATTTATTTATITAPAAVPMHRHERPSTRGRVTSTAPSSATVLSQNPVAMAPSGDIVEVRQTRSPHNDYPATPTSPSVKHIAPGLPSLRAGDDAPSHKQQSGPQLVLNMGPAPNSRVPALQPLMRPNGSTWGSIFDTARELLDHLVNSARIVIESVSDTQVEEHAQTITPTANAPASSDVSYPESKQEHDCVRAVTDDVQTEAHALGMNLTVDEPATITLDDLGTEQERDWLRTVRVPDGSQSGASSREANPSAGDLLSKPLHDLRNEHSRLRRANARLILDDQASLDNLRFEYSRLRDANALLIEENLVNDLVGALDNVMMGSGTARPDPLLTT